MSDLQAADKTRILSSPQRMPVLVAVIYLACGVMWIVLSDGALEALHLGAAQTAQLQTYKGWLFILGSSAVLYLLLRGHARRGAEALVELRESEARARSSEEGYRVISQVTNDAIWDRDLDSNMVRWNDGITRLFGHPEREVGNTFDWFVERVHPEDRARVMDTNTAAIARGGPFTHRYRFRRHDGSFAHVVDRGYAFLRSEGGRARMIGGITDISALVESENEIRRINSELEQRVAERTRQLEFANRELEAFVYAVSHDLRAPLRGMSGFSQALQELAPAGLDDKARHYLQRIQQSSRKMSELIDDLLSLSRISRSDMALRDVDLTQLCTDAAAAVREHHPGRNVSLSIEPGMQVYGDARLLRIAMENLLDNAWKYTSQQPQATVNVGRENLAGESVFFVRDNGVGFDMAYAGKLFAPFQRLHPEAQFSGTGIGLVTVQRILARHGGRIWAEAEVDRGAVFRFTLPPPAEHH